MRFVHYNIYNSTIIFYYYCLLYLYNIIIICDIDYPFILGFSWECHCNLPRLEAHLSAAARHLPGVLGRSREATGEIRFARAFGWWMTVVWLPSVYLTDIAMENNNFL